MDQSKGRRRWPFTVPGDAGALSEGGGQSWVIVSDAGRYLRAFFGGVPDWCALRGNARRYTAQDAAAALCRVRQAGEAAAQVAA